jgi:uncharacterized protein DUF6438
VIQEFAMQHVLLGGIIFLSSMLFGASQKTDNLRKCDGEIVITIERSSCFGDCPVYSAEIHADGTVVYVGKSNVKEIGERRTKISQEKIRELVKEFQQINYFSLKDEYQTDESGMTVSDLPTTATSICLDGKLKQVVNYFGAPKELRALQEKIDSLAGLYQFLGRSKRGVSGSFLQ